MHVTSLHAQLGGQLRLSWPVFPYLVCSSFPFIPAESDNVALACTQRLLFAVGWQECELLMLYIEGLMVWSALQVCTTVLRAGAAANDEPPSLAHHERRYLFARPASPGHLLRGLGNTAG